MLLWRAGRNFNGEQGLLPAMMPSRPALGTVSGVFQKVRRWISAVDLPDVSNVFREIAPASDCQATLHGVVFDILDSRSAPAFERTKRAAGLRLSRSKSSDHPGDAKRRPERSRCIHLHPRATAVPN